MVAPVVRPAAACRSASRPALQVVRASINASASVPKKGADGADKGTEQLALRVAEDTAKHVVHRYMVMVLQNKRRVSGAGAVNAPTPCGHRLDTTQAWVGLDMLDRRESPEPWHVLVLTGHGQLEDAR